MVYKIISLQGIFMFLILTPMFAQIDNWLDSADYYLNNGYPKRAEYLLNHITLIPTGVSDYQLARSYCVKGDIYLQQTNIQLALPYYNKALKMSKEINNIDLYARVLLNLGQVYTYLKDSESANHFIKEGIKMSDSPDHLITAYRRMAAWFERFQSNNDSASFYYLKSLNLAIIQKDTNNMARNYLSIGKINYYQGNNSMTVKCLSKAKTLLDSIQKSHLYNNSLVYHNLLYKIARDAGDSKTALHHQKKFTELADSISVLKKHK